MDVWLGTLVGAAALLVSGLLGWPVTAGVLRLAARSADAGGHQVGAGTPKRAPVPGAGAPARGVRAAVPPGRAGSAKVEPPAMAGSAKAEPPAKAGSAKAEPPAKAGSTHAGPANPTPDEADVGVSPVSAKARAALRGGTWIGVLERVAITACLLASYPGGVAVVVAVKGLGRYPELREHPDVSERFVIGTFASMLWATGVGLAGQALLLR